MAHIYEAAATGILKWLHRAERDLVGHVITTFNGEAGTIEDIRLDENHGLCFTIDPPIQSGIWMARRWYPVATIKHHGPIDDARTVRTGLLQTHRRGHPSAEGMVRGRPGLPRPDARESGDSEGIRRGRALPH